MYRISAMAKVNILLTTVGKYMKAIGTITNLTVMPNSISIPGQNTKGISQMVLKTVTAPINGQINKHIQVTGKIISWMARVFSIIMMVQNILDNG